MSHPLIGTVNSVEARATFVISITFKLNVVCYKYVHGPFVTSEGGMHNVACQKNAFLTANCLSAIQQDCVYTLSAILLTKLNGDPHED